MPENRQPTPGPPAAEAPRLLMKDIAKSFPGVRALHEVSFELLPSEIHALVGENGAGKSTLIKILAGALERDSGELFVDGRPVHIRTPQVIGFHLLPNAPAEPPDYDPSESNRKMEPVSVLVGPFRFDAAMRISNMPTLAKYVEIFSDVYISLYDAAVTCPLMPGLGVVRAPLALIRRDAASFAPRV